MNFIKSFFVFSLSCHYASSIVTSISKQEETVCKQIYVIANQHLQKFNQKRSELSLCKSDVLNFIDQGTLVSGISCMSSGHCVAVGFESNNLKSTPVSFITSDSGVNWSNSTSFPVEGINGQILNKSFCDEKGHCVAVGFDNDIWEPLIFTSTDSGMNWQQASINPTARSLKNTILYDVTCNQSGSCKIVGDYFIDENHSYPLSFTSADYGGSWKVASAMTPVHSDKHNIISSISCDINQCAAVGFYSTTCNQLAPLSFYSSDSGNSWTLSDTLPKAMGRGENRLLDIYCYQSQCIAVGSYLDYNQQVIPLSYVSSDFGISWKFSTTIPPVMGTDINELESVSCASNYKCTAVGYYYNNLKLVPLSYYSEDMGENWQLANISVPTTPYRANILNEVSCEDDGRCVAVGFSANDASQKVPLSYTSTDFGANWNLSITLPSLK